MAFVLLFVLLALLFPLSVEILKNGADNLISRSWKEIKELKYYAMLTTWFNVNVTASIDAFRVLFRSEKPSDTRTELTRASRIVDWMFLICSFFVLLGSYHIYAILTMGGDSWTDWKDRRLWVTVTPIMAITFCAAAQYMLWEKFRLPIGATLAVLGLLFGEWINRYFNFWGWTYFPLNMLWPISLVPSAIVLDVILLLSRSYLLTALIGGLAFSLLMYPTNWPHLAPFHVLVEYHGNVMSLADLIGYQYVRTGTPEYIRIVEKGTLRTFGKDVVPVPAFFSGFICILIYTLLHFIGRWFSTAGFLWKSQV
jgi:methane/ammonia monooxygenase subunit A